MMIANSRPKCIPCVPDHRHKNRFARRIPSSKLSHIPHRRWGSYYATDKFPGKLIRENLQTR